MEKILLVDDEQSVLDAFHRQLRKQFNIETAVSGREGLKKIADIGPFAVIVSDMRMPVMDGMTMLGELRKDNWGRGAEVIILTNLFDQKKVADAIALGSFDYLVKTDWSLADVIKKIKEKLEPFIYWFNSSTPQIEKAKEIFQ